MNKRAATATSRERLIVFHASGIKIAAGRDTNENKRKDGEIGGETDFSQFRLHLSPNKRKVNNGHFTTRAVTRSRKMLQCKLKQVLPGCHCEDPQDPFHSGFGPSRTYESTHAASDTLSHSLLTGGFSYLCDRDTAEKRSVE